MSGLTAWERWELASFDHEVAAPPVAAVPSAGSGVLGEVDRATIERLCREAQEAGYEAGYQSGFQIGKRSGSEAGQSEVAAEAERIGRAATRLDQTMREFNQQVADEVVALAIEIARQVVRSEIALRPDGIQKLVNEALAQLPHQHAVIFLHPDDAARVRAAQGEAFTHAGHRIIDAPELSPGDCRIEAGSSQVDATVATRWRRVVESLGATVPWQDPAAP